MEKFKYIYGPVYSWRLGSSLGIDPLQQKDKVCTFNCSYCQIGGTKVFTSKRQVFSSTEPILKEISSLPKTMKIDYITFSGNGEPTLAKNLGEIIRGVRRLRKEKIAVITNASLINRNDVQADLALADFVLLKLDANAGDIFREMNGAMDEIMFGDIIKGIRRFKEMYRGRLALQIMFTKKNMPYAGEIARTALKLGIKEVQLNTPLRESKEEPVSKKEMDTIKGYFKGIKISYVYDAKKKDVKPLDRDNAEKIHGRVKR